MLHMTIQLRGTSQNWRNDLTEGEIAFHQASLVVFLRCLLQPEQTDQAKAARNKPHVLLSKLATLFVRSVLPAGRP